MTIELADRAIELRDDLTQHLGDQSATIYTNIEMNYAMGLRKIAPLKGRGRDFRKPIGTHQIKAKAPEIRSKQGFRRLPDTLDRELCLKIYTALEVESEAGNALVPGWLLQSEISDTLGVPIARRNDAQINEHCDAMRAIGLLEVKQYGKKNLYRVSTCHDRSFERGQLVLSSLWGQSPRIGIIVEIVPHDIHPIDILTVRWVGRNTELIGSDIALPVMRWAEENAGRWLGIELDKIRQERLRSRNRADWRALTDRERILEVLRWGSSNISEIWAVVQETHQVDLILDRLEREHKILRSRSPNGFYRYSLA